LKTWVLDAGVAAKWHLAGEPLADEAIGMLHQFQTGDIEFLVPDLFLPGFGNVLWKAAGQARISSADAERAIGSLAADVPATAPSQPLLGNAFAHRPRQEASMTAYT
jgi:hypothetical protein